ncbi:MAG: DNA polymerase Y family protein [Pseudomonadales bacterium]
MLWLGIHFPYLPLEVFTRESVRQAATVVIDAGGRVVLTDAAAAAAGIAPGGTLASAHSILPALDHHRRDPAREQRRLRLLAEALYRFSATVSLAPPGGVMLEIGASLKLFGDAAHLAGQAEAVCRDLGHEARARWARTPLAALALARAGAASLDDVPLAAAAIEPAHLTAEQIERCANMGVRTLGRLLALPRRELARRFGDGLIGYLARLSGDRADPRPGIRPAERFRSTLHLLEPLASKEAIVFPMQRLLTDLQHWLVARQLGAEQIRWLFVPSGGSRQAVRLPVRFSAAQQSRDAFLDITRLALAEAALPADVIDLTLEAGRLRPWAPDSHGLFPHQAGGATAADGNIQALGRLVDQLQARLGRDACCGLVIRDQHTPERAWVRRPPLERGPTLLRGPTLQRGPTRQRVRAAEPAAAGRRPLWLFDPPRAVRRDRLTLLEGPERVHTGWWLGGGEAGQARDYYVAREHDGAQCWVFVDPAEQWFLHGYF